MTLAYDLGLTTDEFDAIPWAFLGSELAEQTYAEWPMAPTARRLSVPSRADRHRQQRICLQRTAGTRDGRSGTPMLSGPKDLAG
jgi:hypothetical protein